MKAPPRTSGIVWTILATLAIGGGPAGSLRAEDGVVLKPRFTVGSRFVIKNESDMTMAVPIGGSDSQQNVRAEQMVSTAVDAHEDGTHKVVKVTVDSIRLEMEMQGMEMRYDSTDPASKDSFLAGPLKGIVNQTFEMIYDENDEFVRIENADALKGGGGAAPSMGVEFGEEQIKQILQSQFAQGFSDQPVKVGDSWEQEIKAPMPKMGDLEFRMKYFYRKDASVDGHPCAVIDVAGMMADVSVGSDGAAAGGKGFAAGLQDTKISGTIAFDKEFGVPRMTEMDMDMVIAVPNPLGADSAMKVPMKQKTTTTLVEYVE